MRRLLLLLALVASGCAHGYRVNGGPLIRPGSCRDYTVPFYWADGTVGSMPLTVCVTEAK